MERKRWNKSEGIQYKIAKMNTASPWRVVLAATENTFPGVAGNGHDKRVPPLQKTTINSY